MRKASAFAKRNIKEMIRDPLTLVFGVGFPLLILLLLTAINKNIPGASEVFSIGSLTPGIIVFGYSFICLFSGFLVSKDRDSAFMLRLMTSPMLSWEYIIGYLIPLLPMAVAQASVSTLCAIPLGLEVTPKLLLMIAATLPIAVFFAGLGLMLGSVLNEKQVGGICGALVTNLAAWLSGAWFEPSLIGGAFEKIANILPFWRAVKAARNALSGNGVISELWWVIVWAIVMLGFAVLVFSRKMKRD